MRNPGLPGTMIAAALLALAPLVPAGHALPPAHAALAQLPPTMLWAWERAENLRWLPPQAGVAYVAATIELEADRVRLRPRAHRLLVRPDTVVVPVVHVDASERRPPVLDAAQRDAIVGQVLDAAAATAGTARVVQLDFEVRRSQRAFLMDTVGEIRRQLPASVALSVTALASWCAGDYWIASLAADEIVPMAFRMARDDAPIRQLLADRGGFVRERCAGAIGMATDEPVARVSAARQYFFSPVAWDQDAWRRLRR